MKDLEVGLPPQLNSFLTYWASRMVNGMPPIRDQDFSPGALRTWLGHLALIERHCDGGFRFRLAGTKLQNRFGAELTNRNFAEIEDELLGDLEDRVKRAMSLPSPVVKAVWCPKNAQRYFDLILPLADVAGSINLVILASYPVNP